MLIVHLASGNKSSYFIQLLFSCMFLLSAHIFSVFKKFLDIELCYVNVLKKLINLTDFEGFIQLSMLTLIIIRW
jgi:hypothetical protein